MSRLADGRRPAPTSGVGSVALVGGGPGDPELLTVAAMRALETADVVLVDRLAPHDGLDELAPRAELVDVGKRPGYHPIPQREIERIMVERALGGASVVRLKGGDPFVFGRGGEEVAACRAAGVPVRVIPGVTSAVAVPAAAGIPVTDRGASRMFTVLSGHAPLTDAELQHLAALGGTIVVLMGVSNLPPIVAGLVRHGMPPSTPVTVVERGCTPRQRTILGDLRSVLDDALHDRFESPAVIVVGAVVEVALATRATADADAVIAAAAVEALASAAAASPPVSRSSPSSAPATGSSASETVGER